MRVSTSEEKGFASETGGERLLTTFRLEDDRGIAIEVLDYGATLTGVYVPDKAGRRINVVVRLPTNADYLNDVNDHYVGSTLGRFGRCISNAEFWLDGSLHKLVANAGHHHFHGGLGGFHRKSWHGETRVSRSRAQLCLKLVSPDGDQGYPGSLLAETIFTLDGLGMLTIEHRAVTTSPTVVGLVNHAFWNLAGEGTVDGHALAVNADSVILTDDELIPLPEPPMALAGTAWDYRKSTDLAGKAIDSFFALSGGDWAAVLEHRQSGRCMIVATDGPGIGVYTGDSYLHPRAGICLQCGPFPDAPNRPDFPTARLDPGSVYVQRTRYRFLTT